MTRPNGVTKARRRKLAVGVDPMIVWIAEYGTGESMTMKVLADLAGVAEVTMAQWFSGATQPVVGNLRAVVNALGYDLKLVRIK